MEATKKSKKMVPSTPENVIKHTADILNKLKKRVFFVLLLLGYEVTTILVIKENSAVFFKFPVSLTILAS